ncbi:MAG: hypothetical protein ACRCTI_01900 [Beijerinckiaceae bacterium]
MNGRLVIAAALFAGLATPAAALEFSLRGNAVYISGSVVLGDNAKFEEFMGRPAAANARIFYLNSGGGSLGNALDIARLIRKRGGATVVDGRSRCESACTVIFAGGTSRHYVNSGGLEDRLGGKVGGLGYHEGNNANADGRGRTYSGRASQASINALYEMGSGSAAQFVTRAGHNGMYRISGQTALANGVATSLSPP